MTTIVFNVFDDMIKNISLTTGVICKTLGRFTIDDGGGATYRIASTDEGKSWAEPMLNGYFALIDQKDVVTYKMFGAPLNGIDDDTPAMIQTHAYANSIYTLDYTKHLQQFPVAVEQHGGTIYRKQTGVIDVYTNMDLSGSTILYDDLSASWDAWYWVGQNGSSYFTGDFTTSKDAVTTSLTVSDTSSELTPDQKAQLTEGSHYFTMLDNSIPANIVFKLTEAPYAARDDVGSVYTVGRAELMVHDMHGICTGPLATDWSTAGGNDLAVIGPHTNMAQEEVDHSVTYKSEFKISYTIANNVRQTIIGCDVIINTSPNSYVTLMYVHQHNCTVKDFTIRPNGDSLRNADFKNAVIYIRESYGVEIENIRGFNVAGRENVETGFQATSGYMIRMTNCLKISVKNCRLLGYWGCMAMNNVKDVSIRDCEVNRIDIHDYFSNFYVDNCIVYHHAIQVGFGTGVCSITNCKLYSYPVKDLRYNGQIVTLNQSYGRCFRGELIVENCYVKVFKNTGPSFNPSEYFKLVTANFTPNAANLATEDQWLPEMRFKNITIESVDVLKLAFMYFEGTHTKQMKMFRRASFENIDSNILPAETKVVVFSPTCNVPTILRGAYSKVLVKNCGTNIVAPSGQWFGRSSNPIPTYSNASNN
jgi:hypothetical protein